MNLQLVHGRGPLAVGGAEAIHSRVAASNDDYPLARSNDLVGLIEMIACHSLVLLSEIIHRKVDALQVTPGNARDRDAAQHPS